MFGFLRFGSESYTSFYNLVLQLLLKLGLGCGKSQFLSYLQFIIPEQMKNLTLLLLFASSALIGQNAFDLQPTQTDVFGFPDMPAQQLLIEKAQKDKVMLSCQKLFKKEVNGDVDVTDNTITFNEVLFKGVSSETYKVYSFFREETNGVSVIYALRDSSGNVNLEEEVNGTAIKKRISSFAKQTYVEALNEELAIEKTHLKNLEKENASFQKEIDRNHKSILKSQANVDNLQMEIEMNRKEYEAVLEEYQTHKSIYADTDKKDLNYKSVKANYKAVQSKKKDLEKEYVSMNEKVYDEQNSITQLQKEIESMEVSKEELEAKILDQTSVVKKTEDEIYHLRND